MRVGDIGTKIISQIVDQDGEIIPIGSAISMLMKLSKPNGTVVQKTPTLLTDGTDGKLVYSTLANDIDIDGTWKSQSWVQLPGGSWHTSIEIFDVEPNLIYVAQ
jgi:hypothetical protein